jgi:hypothetical protein
MVVLVLLGLIVFGTAFVIWCCLGISARESRREEEEGPWKS